ncbi:hypothetical protein HT576_23440 [Haloterrigena sp. SYSU A121-1]|uniref:Uncharacterized protein n=1 Tax=Haloterrigena gelatinilytica TaxID=2741724 RepID=A0A8J8GTX7_9EURY|nr:hypothetical protein [Haloterrigena gelatinilytica]NUB93932.1 hypothetical protein [Haloterrigena gelatinilytica]
MSETDHATPSGRAIERGGVYAHATHSRVEVTQIWQGTQWTEAVTVPSTEEREIGRPIVVRYIPAADGDWRDELAATLDEFHAAIASAD